MHQHIANRPYHAIRGLPKRHGPMIDLQFGVVSTTIVSSQQTNKGIMKTKIISSQRPHV